MSDNGQRRYAEPEEGLREREPRRTYHEERQVIDHTSPLWRLLGVSGAVGAVVLLGFYLEGRGLGDEFGTIAVVTIVFSLKYWANKRPDRARKRAGEFSGTVDAIRQLNSDWDRFTMRCTFRAAVGIGFITAVGIVLAKSALVALLSGLYSWHLAAMVGAGVGAVVVAPQLYADLVRRLRGEKEDEEGYEENADEEDDEEYARERPGYRRSERREDGEE